MLVSVVKYATTESHVVINSSFKTTKNLRHDSRYPGRDLNLEPPEYEAEVLTIRQRRLIL
jgi:hypothetical protein